jgi:type IV conjugative transfer system coupling protein TraD
MYGRTLTQVSHIRGASLSTVFWLRLRLYLTFASGDISLPGFPLPKGAEVTHLGVAGTTGTGKTSFYIFVLDQVRGRRQRAIVYDPSGAYVARYYRPGKDVVAHPFFAEFPGWRLSNEARTVTDYAALAKSMVPEHASGEGGYWSEAARRLAASLFERLHGDSNHTLFEAVQTMPLEDLVALLKGLPAAGVMDLTSPKTAASVRATLATKFDAWRYLKDGPFSIRQWVEQEDDDSWLFIMSRPDERDFLRPLVSLWLDCAVRAVMGLPESRTRRMWLALDELPSLQQLPTLPMAMAEGRRYGLCVVIGYQSWPQLIDVYGLNGAGALDAVARTKVVLACGDALTAQHCAEILGRADELEQKESLTWGISTTRDSGSLQPQRIERWVVTPSELMQLPDRQAYIRLPGPYPVVKIEIPLPPPVPTRSQVQLGHSPLVAPHPSERPSADPVAEAFGFSGRERRRSTTEVSERWKPTTERSR